jgi:hypothetical protein
MADRNFIKVLVSRTDYSTNHEERVNEFLDGSIEVIEISNHVHSGSGFSKYTARPEIVTIITYKEEL